MAFTQPSGLPKGWIKGVAGDYGTYYCHPASGITQWQHPSEPVLSYSLEPADLLEDDGPYASDSMEQGELTDEDEPMDDTAPAMVTSRTCQNYSGKVKRGNQCCTGCTYQIEGFPPGICHGCQTQMKQGWTNDFCHHCEQRAKKQRATKEEKDELWEEQYKKARKRPTTFTTGGDEMNITPSNDTTFPFFLPNCCHTCGDLPSPRPGTRYQGTLYCTCCYYLLVGFPIGVCHGCTSPSTERDDYCEICSQASRNGAFVPLAQRQKAKREEKQDKIIAKIHNKRRQKKQRMNITATTTTAHPSASSQRPQSDFPPNLCQYCGESLHKHPAKKSKKNRDLLYCFQCSYLIGGFPPDRCHGCAQRALKGEKYCGKCAEREKEGMLIPLAVKKAHLREMQMERLGEKKERVKEGRKWWERNKLHKR